MNLGASLGALVAASAGHALAITGSHSCPCGPIGTPATKSTCALPNGDTLKLTCTNQAPTGNFISTYCKADGTSCQIGECIYEGGKNMFCYVYDDDGDLCYIIHKNDDDDDHDNDTHQRKVYKYNVKTGTLTTTCYKRNEDGTYKPVGRPACTTPSTYAQYPTAEAQYEYFNRLAFPDGDPRNDVVEAEPQEQCNAGLVADMRATGSRDIHFESNGMQVAIGVGDRITLYGIQTSDVVNVNPMFTVQPLVGAVGVDLVAVSDGPIQDSDMIVRVRREAAGTPIRFRAVTQGDPAFATMIDAVMCAEVAMPGAMFDQRSISGFGEFETPVLMDLNTDGRIGAHDLAMILSSWGGSSGPADLNGDEWVNAADVGLLLSHWGMSDE